MTIDTLSETTVMRKSMEEGMYLVEKFNTDLIKIAKKLKEIT